MPHQTTATIIQAYLDALIARGDFAAYLAENATFEIVGTSLRAEGREAVRDTIVAMHTQAFDANPKVKTVITGDDQAVLEADFVGTHTGEFLGIAPTGNPVNVPYCVVYDFNGDKITALRGYMAMELFAEQLKGTA
jgi:predicted ester cyclase